MKVLKTLFFAFFLVFIVVQNTNAQDYFLSFSANVDSVQVENLKQGTVMAVSGSEGLFLRKTLLGISRLNLSEKKLQIYPNPSFGNLFIRFESSTSEVGHLDIFDISGKKIYADQIMIGSGKNSFNLSGLHNGIFLLRIYSQSLIYTGKIVCMSSDRQQRGIVINGNDEVPISISEKSVLSAPQMQYNDGDRLKLTGYSVDNSTIVTVIPNKDTLIHFTFYSCIDGDGYSYPVVEIGNQLWMARNLQTSKYDDLTTIACISKDSEWVNLITPAFCYYGFEESNKSDYGSLYNWFALNKDINGEKNICPKGWHVPIDAEWISLSEFLDSSTFVGGKLKETGFAHWEKPNSNASNETGFTGLPAGGFLKDSNFVELGFSSYYWTSTSSSVDSSWCRTMKNDNGEFGRYNYPMICGLSIRCLNDAFYGNAVVPVITTTSADSITGNSVFIGGDLSFDGGATILSRGICWSIHSSPSISDDHTDEGAGFGSFLSSISGLLPNTTYNARSYAVNNVGISYGNEITFKTLAELPELTTSTVSNVFPTTVTCGGDIFSDGGDSILARGVCWSTHTNPTISDNKTSDGSGSGIFVSYIDSLIPNTSYYVRSYAINCRGINYGNEIKFKTKRDEPILTTNTVTVISMSSATSGGTILYEGSKPIISRGICWSKNSSSTINDDIAIDEGFVGNSFSCQLTGLSANTSYSVRAFAITEEGVFYAIGNGFKTSTGPDVRFIDASNITTSSVYCTGELINDGGYTVKERGFCWSTSKNPTVNDNKNILGKGLGEFKTSITGLLENKQYYVKAYATNERGTSYSDVFLFKTLGTVTDIDGNIYTTVTIGNQVWMAENLKTTKYNNGIEIPLVIDNTEWSSLNTAAYYSITFPPDVTEFYYNYYTISDTINICPVGWHVPTYEDLDVLKNLFGGWEIAGGPMKSKSNEWLSPNTGATNASGFSGLPYGLRRNIGLIEGRSQSANWWYGSNSGFSLSGYGFRLWFGDANCKTLLFYKNYGLSIRCIKDD
ncbi:MAG TPA: FISUMP domain-containing protein [Prolixibacteraceae bacterium]|nr:FISUMP domain-containing protein [Prolixibacteraceae bacterium]